MQNEHQNFLKATSCYAILLQRYARRLVEDDTVAAKIVQEVLDCQYDLNALMPSKHLREVLKTDVLNHCYYYLQAKIFDRPLIKVHDFSHLHETPETAKNKKPLLN